MSQDNGVIAEIEKNALEVVRVSRVEYRGHDLVDIRVYYRDDEGEYKPCRKGVSLRVDLIDDLRAAIDKAAECLKTN